MKRYYIYISIILGGLFSLVSCQESVEKNPGFEMFDKDATLVTDVVTGETIVDDRGYYMIVEGSSFVDNKDYPAKEIGVCWSATDVDPKLYIETAAGYQKNFTVGSLKKADKIFVRDLALKTKYYYRTYILNAAGVVYGPVKEHTTNDLITKPAVLKSELFKDDNGAVVPRTVDFARLDSISQFHAVSLYADGYKIVMGFNSKTNAITVAKQKAYINDELKDIAEDKGLVYVTGTGSFDPETNIIELKLTHSYTPKKEDVNTDPGAPEGSGEAEENIEFPSYTDTIEL